MQKCLVTDDSTVLPPPVWSSSNFLESIFCLRFSGHSTFFTLRGVDFMTLLQMRFKIKSLVIFSLNPDVNSHFLFLIQFSKSVEITRLFPLKNRDFLLCENCLFIRCGFDLHKVDAVWIPYIFENKPRLIFFFATFSGAYFRVCLL